MGFSRSPGRLACPFEPWAFRSSQAISDRDFRPVVLGGSLFQGRIVDAAAQRVPDHFGRAGHVQLLLDASLVGTHRLYGKVKRVSDFVEPLAGNDSLQDVELASVNSAWPGASADPLSCRTTDSARFAVT